MPKRLDAAIPARRAAAGGRAVVSGLPDHLQSLYNAVFYFAFNLTKAVLAFLQRDSYLYWPFLLSTVLIMAFVAHRTAARPDADAGRTWGRQFRDYFSADLWWHRSARADYRLYFVNALVLPALFGWLLFSDAQIGSTIDSALGRQAAASAPGAAAGMTERILFTLVFFIAYDFGRFVAHSLLHDISALWEFHKVHHSAEVLTPMTAFRAHPVELLIMAWVPALTTGLATWVFNLFTQAPVGFYTFLGLHVFLWAVNLIDNLRHSNVWVTYGPRLGRWIVSPAHHQLHHSCEPQDIGCNRGFSLAIWDRLYGTLRLPGERAEVFRLGLGDGTDGEWHSVRRMYLQPFKGFALRLRDLFRRRDGETRNETRSENSG